jgi:hypothetical protein
LREAKARKLKLIPPGFRDEECGDLIIWKQLLDKAKDHKDGVIFVTDDQKDDWWQKYGSKGHERTFGPHPLLREEMKTKAGCDCYLYTGKVLLKQAQTYLGIHVEDKVEREVEEAADERKRKYAFQAKPGHVLVSGTYVRASGSRLLMKGEFSQIGALVKEWCLNMQHGHFQEEAALRLLGTLRERIVLFRERWAEILPSTVEGQVSALIRSCESIAVLPIDLRVAIQYGLSD